MLLPRQKEVLKLVSLLCPKIDNNREELKTQHISNALFGLRGLRSEHAETKRLLAVRAYLFMTIFAEHTMEVITEICVYI